MTLGYVVVCKNHPLMLTGSRGHSTLAFGSVGTLFKERRAAAKAVQRTLNYNAAHALPWPEFDDYRIVRLIAER